MVINVKLHLDIKIHLGWDERTPPKNKKINNNDNVYKIIDELVIECLY